VNPQAWARLPVAISLRAKRPQPLADYPNHDQRSRRVLVMPLLLP
jgi:hypothetical protein